MRGLFKILACAVVIFSSSGFVFSQSYSKYVIRFKDKKYTPANLYTIDNPSAYLSAKALQRRANQGISIVQNDLPINPAYIDSVRNAGTVIIINQSKWLNYVTIYTNDSLALAKIKAFPFVLKTEPVFKYASKLMNKNSNKKANRKTDGMYDALKKAPSNLQTREDVYTEKQSSSFNYGTSATQAQMIGVDYLHNMGYRGEGMTIAVLDAGFWNADKMPIFDSLWVNNQILGTRDFVIPGGDVFGGATHGMMVLSIMGGNMPGELVGIAPKANYWLLRSEDSGSEYVIEEYNWVAAAEFADSVGADIINSSLGYTKFDDTTQSHTYADMNGHTCISTIGADIAASKGILVVNSAGNSGADDWRYIGAPADGDSVLSIGAVTSTMEPAYFTSHGYSYDGRIKPNVSAMGQDVIVASTYGSVNPGNGTSFSSPVIAAAAACLWQAFPSITNMQLYHAIEESCSQYTSPDTLVGYGVPNFVAASLAFSGITIQNFDVEKSFNAFPNPFTNDIYLIFFSSDTQMMNIEMVDIEGKRVFVKENIQRNEGYNSFTIDGLENLSQGLYLIRISSKDKVVTKKLLKG